MTIEQINIPPETLQLAKELLNTRLAMQTPDGRIGIRLYEATKEDILAVMDQICDGASAEDVKRAVGELLLENVRCAQRGANVAAVLLQVNDKLRPRAGQLDALGTPPSNSARQDLSGDETQSPTAEPKAEGPEQNDDS